MDTSFNLYVLQSNSCDLLSVNIYKDDKNKKRYVDINNANIYLKILKINHLRSHVCSIKGVGDSDKSNLKLWKVIGVKSKDIKEQNISTEEDIVRKLEGEEMELDEPFSTYFQDELDKLDRDEDYEPVSSIITIISATGK